MIVSLGKKIGIEKEGIQLEGRPSIGRTQPACQRGCHGIWLLDRREVAAGLDHLQLRAWNTSRHGFVIGQRRDRVLPAAHHQSGNADLRQIGV